MTALHSLFANAPRTALAARATVAPRRLNGPRRMAGTTLVELMIASAIGLTILSSLALTFAASSRARAEIDQASQQIENGRYAMELLRDDIQMAGFYGQFTPAGTTPVDASPCATTLANLGWSPSGLTVPIWISAFAAGDAAPSGCALTWQKTSTDALVIRRAGTTPVTVATAGLTANRENYYVQVSACSSDTQPFAVAAGSAGASVFPLHKSDCAAIADLRKFEVHAYYIGTCSACTGSGLDVIPTLRRMELTGGAIVDQSLVEGIEALRVDMALDTDGDGRPETNRRCTSDASQGSRYCPPATLANAMALRVYLLARNLKPTIGQDDDKTYAMGLSGTITPGGAYRRHAYSALVVAMNPSGRREP